MSDFPELPTDAKERIQNARKSADQIIGHARIHLGNAAQAQSHLSEMQSDVSNFGEALDLEQERDRSLECARACAGMATDQFFDVCAWQYWKLIDSDASRFIRLLPILSLEAESRGADSELIETIRAASQQKSIEWSRRVNMDREKTEARMPYVQEMHESVAKFRRQVIRVPARRMDLLEELACDSVAVHLRRVVSEVTSQSKYGQFIDKVFWAKVFIAERLALLLSGEEYETTWGFVLAECERLMGMAAEGVRLTGGGEDGDRAYRNDERLNSSRGIEMSPIRVMIRESILEQARREAKREADAYEASLSPAVEMRPAIQLAPPGKNLRELAENFRTAAEKFQLAGCKLRAEFFALPKREQWGIWKLRPNTRESEPGREKFQFLASLAIQELGVAPIPAPQAREFDPDWSDELDTVEGKDRDPSAPETVPSGLDAVDPCTRAWLQFLRTECIKHKRVGFQIRSEGISIPDVWEASAIQCERSASEQIEAQLRAEAEDREKGFRAAEGLVSGSAKKENTEGSPLRDGLDLSALQDAARRTLGGSFRAYATKIHATEWASYDDGETAEYVKCFGPVARDFALADFEQLTDESETSPTLVGRKVFNLLKATCTQGLPIPIPPTHPWRSDLMFENPDFRAAMREMINGEIGRLRNEMSCSSVAAAADGKTAPVLTDPSSEAGSQILSGGAVAVCPSIVPGLAQEPVPFGSEQEALEWLVARDVKTSPVQMGIDRERGTDDPPSDKGNISEDGTSEAATSTLTNLITVGAHNQRWRAPIPVKKIGGYDLTVRFDGSIASLLPIGITQLPEEPSLEAKIERFFNGESPEITCCLGDDWEFEKIRLSPRVRLGRYNLVDQTGMIGIAFQLACDLETGLNSKFPKLPRGAVKDFWRSWQTSKYLADCCYELGQSDAAIALLKHRESAESAAKRIHDFLVTQVAAFAQSVTDIGINEMPSVATDSESVPVEREGENATSDNRVGHKVSMDQIEMALFEQLSPAGKAGFRKPQTDDVYLVANADFASTCDDSFLDRFPIDRVRSLAGIHAGFVHLSKRLASLAEAYFQDFVNGVDAVAKKEFVPKFGAALTEAWAAAVVQESTRKLWSDVDNVWTEWIRQARQNTEGQAFGARPRPINDRELLILKSHERLMTDTLWRIASRHSIDDSVITETLKTTDARNFAAVRSAHNPEPIPSETVEPQPIQEMDHGRIARETRALTAATLIEELNMLKPQMLEDESEYARLRNSYPKFLAFRVAEQRPDLKLKILSIRSSTRHIRLAQELAAAYHGKELSTIQDDWKDHKPAKFRRTTQKP